MRNEKRNRHYTDNYYFQHQARLDNYILPEFGDFLLTSLTDVAIEDWFVSLTRFNDPKRPLADDSKNKILECFRVVLQEEKRQRLIDKNSAAEVGLITARNAYWEPFNDLELFKRYPNDEKKLLGIWGDRKWAVYFLIRGSGSEAVTRGHGINNN